MNSKQENTIANALANFGTLITSCKAYGNRYNPSNSWLAIASLLALKTRASDGVSAAATAKRIFDDAVIRRKEIFAPLKKLLSRVNSSFKISGASQGKIDDMLGLMRKVKGTRASAASASPPEPSADALPPDAPKRVSNVQTGYINQVSHLKKIIILLESESKYAPNETDLQTATLKSLAQQMGAANHAVAETYIGYKTALNERNSLLYAQKNGMMATAQNVKEYVKSVFSASSHEYKKISKLRFKRKYKLPPLVALAA